MRTHLFLVIVSAFALPSLAANSLWIVCDSGTDQQSVYANPASCSVDDGDVSGTASMSGGITPNGGFAFNATVSPFVGGNTTQDGFGAILFYSYQLPKSPAGDQFEVTEEISTQSNSYIQIGNNPPFTFESAYYGGPYSETIPAAQSISIFGEDNFDVFNHPIGSGYFTEYLDITRVHADGSLDPFSVAPEPASFGLAGIGLLAGLYAMRHKRSSE